MKKKFNYVLKFDEEYLFGTSDIKIAIMLAVFLKKNLEDEGKTGFYDIYCAGMLIAQF